MGYPTVGFCQRGVVQQRGWYGLYSLLAVLGTIEGYKVRAFVTCHTMIAHGADGNSTDNGVGPLNRRILSVGAVSVFLDSLCPPMAAHRNPKPFEGL